jgi:hypothetical protein
MNSDNSGNEPGARIEDLLSRRQFFHKLKHWALAPLAWQAAGLAASLSPTIVLSRADTSGIQWGGLTPEARADRALAIRVKAASANRHVTGHATNGDEQRYENRIANFSKGLRHNALGEPDTTAYGALTTALTSGRQEDFDRVPWAGNAA